MSEIHLEGIAAAEGIALGPAFVFRPPDLSLPARQPGDPAEEMARYAAAREEATAELAAIQARVAADVDEESAAIFEAHQMILNDPTLESSVRGRVEGGQTVEAALVAATDEIAAMFAAMEDEMFAARAADVRDVGRRLLRVLLGVEDTSLAGLHEPAIVVAHELTPSDTAGLQPELTLGLCTAAGGVTSHTAILARTLGIPAVVGIGQAALAKIADGAQLALDGSAGAVVIDPQPETVAQFEAARAKRLAWLEKVGASAEQDAHTADGRRVEVSANVGDIESSRDAVTFGAEGVGLLRTEFLYLQNTVPPDEAQQYRVYREIFEALGDRPVVVRTLDIGGDKPPSYMAFDEELNPFLGWRAIRICLDQPDLFRTQLRAIVRAAEGHNVLIMFPMISALEELREARQILDEVRASLSEEGLPYNAETPVGIMVETPAAAVLADVFARECDFLSIGTNDLTQYTLAVDRTNERVAARFQALHPALLRLVRKTVSAAHEAGIWAGMCGELAGNRLAIPILLGLGLDEFSMTPRAIPEAKWLIGRLTDAQAAEIAQHALNLGTAEEISDYMQGVLAELGA